MLYTLRYDIGCGKTRTRQGSLFLPVVYVLCDTASPVSPATRTQVWVSGLIPEPAAEHRT